jgi:hypothetical protein
VATVGRSFGHRLRWRYRRLACGVARDVADYTNSGFDVVGVVGVAGSPSCGAGITMGLATCETTEVNGARSR